MAIVYLHRRNDIQDLFQNVFYVGIGDTQKRAYSKLGRNKHWHNTVKKFGYAIEITHFDIIWQEACAIEKYLISFYGRRDLKLGSLCNMTDGGDGSLGLFWSIERRDKLSALLKVKLNSAECREKRILLYKNPEHIEKMSKASALSQSRPHIKEKMKAIQKEVHKRPDYLQKMKEASIKGHTIENEIKRSIAQKLAFSTPEAREKKRLSGIEGGKKNAILSSKPIYQLTIDGQPIQKWPSAMAAAKELKVDNTSIGRCCKGTQTHSGGFKFIYA
jgi:hypothetical protein